MAFRMEISNRENTHIAIDFLPEACPICNTQIVPTALSAYIQENEEYSKQFANVFYGCTKCAEVFCVTYAITTEFDHNQYSAIPISILPIPQNKMLISEAIIERFPTAIKLFRDAEFADNHGLVDLSGIGYRKALEHLIKDALIELDIAKHEDVVRLTLNDAINKCLDAPKLQKAAHSARILGNDFAHYEQRCENPTVERLKSLIKLTFYWLEAELEHKKLVSGSDVDSE